MFYFDERLLRISNLSLSRLFCLSSWKMLILHSCNRQKRPSDIKSENNWTKAKKISAPKCKIAKILSRWKQKQKQNYKTRDVCCFSIKTNRQSDEKVIIQMIVLYFVLSFVSRNQFWFTKLSHVALWLTRPTTKTQMIFSFASSTTTNDSIFFPTLTKTPFHFFTNLFFVLIHHADRITLLNALSVYRHSIELHLFSHTCQSFLSFIKTVSK